MFLMQTTTGEAEPDAPQDQRVSKYSASWLWWFVGIFYLWIIAYLLYIYFQSDDTFKLKTMQSTIRFFHCIARIAGTLALDMEREYNDYCELLH
jgi:hypothetical protein